ncbi:5-oxoprolinase subunit PxpA [Psychroflexus lacisalsi]|uniref:5-oxoprolinase subunit PxpA n=1 Tax=Psychroflexus lacisalsi TaxID=503928 RepID=A0ABP3VJR8_9FLAO|nr:5-oxoprolinase subunit PxpA [Psychroflexus lacisalsi]MBZ9620524.1 5-oxoprolinase subunit PxpA [Psychroflexus lacisalsi]
MNKTIDINCDLGEGGNFDADIMPLISSCNIACGGHFGDRNSVDLAVSLAKTHHVNVGAHPSYPDFDNFGRKSMDLSLDELKEHLHQQIDIIEKSCKGYGVKLHHIKPHGALYNDMRKSQKIADLIFNVVIERNSEMILFTPPNVNFSYKIPKSITLWMEGFADRSYQNDLSLVSRKENGAVLNDPDLIFERVLSMINNHEVLSLSGEIINQEFDTICVHSDTANALKILQVLRAKLIENGIKIGEDYES